MKTPNLNDRFIHALKCRFTRKEIKYQTAVMLGLSLDAAYRRISGEVLFTPREIGIVCKNLGISLDRLLDRPTDNVVWMPFILEMPLRNRSMEDLFILIDFSLERIGNIVENTGYSSEFGSLYNTLPLEFYIHSPVLTKFMFFQWGHNYIGSEEFEDYSQWQLPEELCNLSERVKAVYTFDSSYYVWDSALMWYLVRDINRLHLIRVITTNEMIEIREALKDMLSKIEMTLNGTYVPSIGMVPGMTFYVSNINLGFTNHYFSSGDKHFVTFLTNFSYSMIENNPESFNKMKDWTDSFRKVSKQLSSSGRIERKLFFNNQHHIIKQLLGKAINHIIWKIYQTSTKSSLKHFMLRYRKRI